MPRSSCATVSAQRVRSSASAVVSFEARSCFLLVSSMRSASCSFAARLCSYCERSSSRRLRTTASASCFSLSVSRAFSRNTCACSRRWRLGSTTLKTLAYLSSASTHMHIERHATEIFPTTSGVNCGLSTYFFSLPSTAVGMRLLSNPMRRLRKPLSPSTVLAVAQSGFSCSSTHTASITVMTISGGFVYTRISAMSDLSSESSAAIAASSAGRASSRSRWASAAITSHSLAWSRTTASSSSTTRLTASALSWSLASRTSSASVSLAFASSSGRSALSSSCIRNTTVFVSSSLPRPLRRRSRFVRSSSLFSSRMDV
eukprot:Opistho-1_new@9860